MKNIIYSEKYFDMSQFSRNQTIMSSRIDFEVDLIKNMNQRRHNSLLHQKSKHFGVRIIKLVRSLSSDYALRPLHSQLLKSGTSINANVRESEFAQSPADFVNKLSIALKEANETEGWLELLYEAECLNNAGYESMQKDCDELIALLISSINTTKRNNNL